MSRVVGSAQGKRHTNGLATMHWTVDLEGVTFLKCSRVEPDKLSGYFLRTRQYPNHFYGQYNQTCPEQAAQAAAWLFCQPG